MTQNNVDISILFDSKGHLQKTIVDWLHHAMGFDLDVIQQTRFIQTNKLSTHGRTFYKWVWYQNPTIKTNATHFYSLNAWLNLIAHEIYHRQEMGNNLFSASKFGISYGFYWVWNWIKGKNPYYDNLHEIRAFEMGCSNDSKVNRWLSENKFEPHQAHKKT